MDENVKAPAAPQGAEPTVQGVAAVATNLPAADAAAQAAGQSQAAASAQAADQAQAAAAAAAAAQAAAEAQSLAAERDAALAQRDAAHAAGELVNAELAALTEKLAQYEANLMAEVARRIEHWPEEVKALVPAVGDALLRLGHVHNLEPLAARLLHAPAAPGVGPAPTPGVQAPGIEDLKARKLKGAAYPTF